MEKIILMILLSVIATAMITSCNTIRGAGRDVEKVGSAVSHL